MRKERITQKGIAEKLGISVSTVSRALGDNPDINDETKASVRALAKEENYQPNLNALSLKRNKSYRIGVIIPEVAHHFFSSIIGGIMDYADENGYSVLITQSNESYAREVKEAEQLFSTQVDGMLVALSNETSDCEHFKIFQDYGIPVVFFDKTRYDFDASSVVVNDLEGAYGATKHLISIGSKRIAHIKGPRKPLISKRRLQGYIKALEEHGFEIDEELIHECLDVSREEGYEFTKKMLKLPKPPDAIFAVRDMVAVGAIDAIKEAGLRVPEDIAIIGFSDSEIATIVSPKLSSVSQVGFDIGTEATKLLLEEMPIYEDDKVPMFRQVVLNTELKIRESTTR